MNRWCPRTILSLAIVMAAGPAWADCDQLERNAAYQQHYQEGADALDAGHLEQALDAFDAAQALCAMDPGLTYAIGVTQLRMERCALALQSFEAARQQLASGLIATPLTADKIDARVAQASAQCSPGTLAVRCADDGVELEVAGAAPAICPAELTLPAGTHTIMAVSPGRLPRQETVVIEPGMRSEWNVEALDEAGVTLLLTCPAGVDEVEALEVETGHTMSVKCGGAALPPGSYQIAYGPGEPRQIVITQERPAIVDLKGVASAPAAVADGGYAGWLAGGAGLALLGTGIALHFVAEADRQDIRQLQGTVVRDRSQAELRDTLDSADAIDTAGAVLIGVGSAALAAGVLVLVLDASAEESAALLPTPNGVAWSCRF